MVLRDFDSDFKYDKLQIVLQASLIIIGPLGRTNLIMEVEEFWRNSARLPLSVIPGNQTILLSKTPLAILILRVRFR
jgi:hypothetical protein